MHAEMIIMIETYKTLSGKEISTVNSSSGSHITYTASPRGHDDSETTIKTKRTKILLQSKSAWLTNGTH